MNGCVFLFTSFLSKRSEDKKTRICDWFPAYVGKKLTEINDVKNKRYCLMTFKVVEL